jgi:hypothetical protein
VKSLTLTTVGEEALVPELTPSADRYIAATLARAGRVSEDALDWVPVEERGELLGLYLEAHRAEATLGIEGGELIVGPVAGAVTFAASASETPLLVPAVASHPSPAPPSPPPSPSQAGSGPAYPSPVDQVMGYGSTKALLDSKPAPSPVPGWGWLLPLFLGLLGGIIGWVALRDDNPRGARNVLVVGVVVSVLSACFSFVVMSAAGPMLASMSSSSASWPATGQATGRPALYYFGTST